MPGAQPGGWMVKEEKEPSVAETNKPVEKKVVLMLYRVELSLFVGLFFVSWVVRGRGIANGDSFEILWKAWTERMSM